MNEPPAVGVLGGTFDPVHLGHLAVALGVLERTGLRRVLMLPCAIPPHKTVPRLAPERDRERMLGLAVAGHAGLEVCTLELESGRVCYTIDMLRLLRDGPAPCRPVFIMGMDSLLELDTWREHESLTREFDLIVADRERPAGGGSEAPSSSHRAVVSPGGSEGDPDGWRTVGLGRGGRIFHMRMKPVPVSSREIRRVVAAGGSLYGLVPPAVARYIHVNNLYREEERS